MIHCKQADRARGDSATLTETEPWFKRRQKTCHVASTCGSQQEFQTYFVVIPMDCQTGLGSTGAWTVMLCLLPCFQKVRTVIYYHAVIFGRWAWTNFNKKAMISEPVQSSNLTRLDHWIQRRSNPGTKPPNPHGRWEASVGVVVLFTWTWKKRKKPHHLPWTNHHPLLSPCYYAVHTVWCDAFEWLLFFHASSIPLTFQH